MHIQFSPGLNRMGPLFSPTSCIILTRTCWFSLVTSMSCLTRKIPLECSVLYELVFVVDLPQADKGSHRPFTWQIRETVQLRTSFPLFCIRISWTVLRFRARFYYKLLYTLYHVIELMNYVWAVG